MEEKRLEIRSVDLWTVLKVGVLMGLISGVFIVLLAYVGIGVGVRIVWHTEIPGVYRQSFEKPGLLLAAIGVLAYTLLFGLWAFAIGAVYNISAAIVGGVVIRVRGYERDELDDEPFPHRLEHEGDEDGASAEGVGTER